MSITITYIADAIQLDEESLVNAIAVRASKHLQELGQHVADVASARAPVGKGQESSVAPISTARSFNPRTSSFQGLRLKPIGSFGLVRGEGSKAGRLLELHGLTSRQRARAVRPIEDRDLFQGTGGNKGKTPDIIEIQRGTIKGAFKGKQHLPGTLRKSIRFVGVERRDNRVVAVVRAHAPYAMAVHEGFKHEGGRGHDGESTEVAGQPFLKNALINIQGRLTEASAYEG